MLEPTKQSLDITAYFSLPPEIQSFLILVFYLNNENIEKGESAGVILWWTAVCPGKWSTELLLIL